MHSERLKNVLVIDDEMVNNFILRKNFEMIDIGIDLVEKQNADEAILYLQHCKETGVFPQLILVDIHMPIKNGFDFIEAYETQFFDLNPDGLVFFLSSSNFESDRVKAISYKSVTGFYSKYNLPQFLHSLSTKYFYERG